MGADSTVLRGVAGAQVVLGNVCGCMHVHGVGVGECAWRVVGGSGRGGGRHAVGGRDAEMCA